MAKMENLIEKRFKPVEEKYREELDLVSEALGKPCIILHVQLPEGCEEYKELFERLPEDEVFMAELQEFVRQALKKRAGKLLQERNQG